MRSNPARGVLSAGSARVVPGVKAMRQGLGTLRRVLRVADVTARGHGYARSVWELESVDADGRPVPWYTYACTEWLSQLDLSALEVFEYGSGNSTRWWAERCRALTSVEHDPVWHGKVAQLLPPDVRYLLEPAVSDYVQSCDGEYDIVIVDGVYRYDCALHAMRHLREGGVIIVDNADWMWNTASCLRAAGFLQVDFVGPGPINNYAWATSVMIPTTSRLQHRDRMQVVGGIEQQGGHDTTFLSGQP